MTAPRERAVAPPGVLRRLVGAAGDLLLGAACPGCGRPGLGLCPVCGGRLARRVPERVAPSPPPTGFPACVGTGPYDDLLRAVLAAFKEQQALLLAPVLGDLLADAALPLLVPGRRCVLVPVPSSPVAVRRRGLDATLTLARRAARSLRRDGHDVVARRRLRLTRAVADQSVLGADARRRNVAGAYAARPGRPGRARAPVVVVDDLVTTGSSVAEATRALAAAGFAVVGAAVVAATERRVPTLDRDHRDVSAEWDRTEPERSV